MKIEFWDDELFTVAAALECAMTECERRKQYKLADRFSELYKRIDDAVRGDLKNRRETLDKFHEIQGELDEWIHS